jgi:hypothetical protein
MGSILWDSTVTQGRIGHVHCHVHEVGAGGVHKEVLSVTRGKDRPGNPRKGMPKVSDQQTEGPSQLQGTHA